MATYLILLDLRDDSGSRERVGRFVESFDRRVQIAAAHLVESDRDVRQVRDACRSRLSATESVVVVEVSGMPWATGGASSSLGAWLRQHVSGRRGAPE